MLVSTCCLLKLTLHEKVNKKKQFTEKQPFSFLKVTNYSQLNLWKKTNYQIGTSCDIAIYFTYLNYRIWIMLGQFASGLAEFGTI